MKCQRTGCSGDVVEGICEDCGRPPVGEKVMPSIIQSSQSAPSAGNLICPDCGTPNPDDNRFCEVCKYDFHKQASGMGVPPVEETVHGQKIDMADRKSTRLNSSHLVISYAVFCL